MAKAFPGTLLEFEHWFRTEEACRSYLERLRWPNGFVCTRCGPSGGWRTSRGYWHCRRCRRDVSVTAGTIFEGSHLPLRVWFRAIWWVTNQKNGVSALGLQRLLGLGSYKTAWMCLHKLRRAMVRPNRELLGGRIELDETFVGGVKRGTSSSTTKAAVAIAAEIRGDGTGRIRLKRLPRNIEPCVVDFVQANIAAGSEILTDGANNYRRLRLYGYKHTGTSLIAKGREASNAVIPRVHRVASLLKRWLLGAHQGRVSTEQLDHYLAEFAFRFNRRASPQRGMLFYRLLQQAVVQKPSPYKVITREVERTV